MSRIATAFRLWLARLEADKEADSAAKDAWNSGNSGFRRRIINAFASDEIFGPQGLRWIPRPRNRQAFTVGAAARLARTRSPGIPDAQCARDPRRPGTGVRSAWAG